MPARDLQKLFEEARGLDEEAQRRILAEVRAENPAVAEELEALLAVARMLDGGIPGSETSPGVRASTGAPSVDDGGSADFAATVLEQLEKHRSASGRYEVHEEVGRGGQGAVLRVWDEDLRRDLAMKVIRGAEFGGLGAINRNSLSRFLKEAQVTSQLDHPGVVPVHELGLDAQGRVYFTMKLVKGRDLSAIFKLVRDGKEGWSRTRALGVLLKICDAMAYAHAKGVIHRDLKPQNIMVGSYGEAYVMDWGIARVQGQASPRDVRIKPLEPVGDDSWEGQFPERALDTPLVTMDGDIVGTPAYMSPEQAQGQPENMGPHSDVYSAGAMLYELLSGRKPYVEPGKRPNDYAIWHRVRSGPPEALERIAADAPPELIAICEKAMEREPALRYPDMSDLGEDLRAFLEDRVVGAYETGAVAELRSWIRRNKSLATAIAAVVVLTIGGLATVSYQQSLSAEKGRDVLRLSAFRALEDLQREAHEYWPAHPLHVQDYEAWLDDANELIRGLAPDPGSGDPGHRRQLARLIERALPWPAAEREAFRIQHPRFDEWLAVGQKLEQLRLDGGFEAEATLTHLEAEHAALDEVISSPPYWRFEDKNDLWWHGQLEHLVAEIESLEDEEAGLIDGISAEYGWGIRRRLAFAESIEERSLAGPAVRRRWIEAHAAIAAHPQYAGLRLEPQLGLVPIGPDPSSGLWEFWHVQTGAEPRRDADGGLVLVEGMGLVFVLIPGGDFWMGSQKDDPEGKNYDLGARDEEIPAHLVTVSTFFLSKFEMTQGQWERFTGSNPSSYDAEKHAERKWNAFGRPFDSLHPVGNISWDAADRITRNLGLTLPSEAQWEYAARAGFDLIWGASGDPSLLEFVANMADAYADVMTQTWVCEAWTDGYTFQSPIGSFLPNAFGLHDLQGNMTEWCYDGFRSDAYQHQTGLGRVDPVVEPETSPQRCARGGDYNDVAWAARCAQRGGDTPDYRSPRMGLRPACEIQFR